MPTPQLTNPLGAFGYTAATGASEGQLVLALKSAESSTTIAKGDCVIWSTTAVILQSTASVSRLSVGISLESIAPGEIGLICVYGVVEAVNCESGVAAADLLSNSGSTAGRVNTLTSATTTQGQQIGIAITAASSNTCTMFVCK